MKKVLLSVGILALSATIASANVNIIKEIEVYQVPLKTYLTSDSVKTIEKEGVLEKRKIIKTQNGEMFQDKKGNELIVIFNKNLNNKEKISLLLKALKKIINESDNYNKAQMLKLINIIKNLNKAE